MSRGVRSSNYNGLWAQREQAPGQRSDVRRPLYAFVESIDIIPSAAATAECRTFQHFRRSVRTIASSGISTRSTPRFFVMCGARLPAPPMTGGLDSPSVLYEGGAFAPIVIFSPAIRSPALRSARSFRCTDRMRAASRTFDPAVPTLLGGRRSWLANPDAVLSVSTKPLLAPHAAVRQRRTQYPASARFQDVGLLCSPKKHGDPPEQRFSGFS